YPAAARLNVGLPVLDQSRANGDAAVEVAIEGEIAHATAIGTALGLFEFRNDLHGAHLGRAAQRPRWKGGAHQIIRSFTLGKAAFHLRNNVHHMAVTLDDHQVLDLHAPVIADPPEIVARE